VHVAATSLDVRQGSGHDGISDQPL